MIQRIQTVYLLIVTALLIASMCLPIGTFTDGAGVYAFKPLGMELLGAFQSTWGLLGILILSAMTALVTIFLFKNRMLQVRMTVFNSILLIGYYGAVLAFYFAFKTDANTFQLHWALCLPFIAILFNLLAMRAIKHDENMVKATDRLR